MLNEYEQAKKIVDIQCAEIQLKINDLNVFELTAFYDMVSITGSLILGLAIINGRLSAEKAYQLSRVDELWQ